LLFAKGSAVFSIILVIIFVLIGLSWALVNVTNLTIVSNLASEGLKGQAFGIYNAIVGMGGIIGSLLGGYLADFLGYLAAFIAAAVFVLVGLRIALKALSYR
jgi:MFS family permease